MNILEMNFENASLDERMKALKEILDTYSYRKQVPCETPKDGKECADQGLNQSKMCSNCLKAWTRAAELTGQTPDEALEVVRKRKAEAKQAEYLDKLCTAPCDRDSSVYGHCADQGFKVDDMCPNCKKFWKEASASAGDTPEQAIARSKAIQSEMLGGANERPNQVN